MVMGIKGIPVVLYDRIRTGIDPLGKPIFKEVPITVDDVLVAPAESDNVLSSTSLEGKKAVYQLAIPKGDEHVWEDRIVEFFGQKWKTFGYFVGGVEANIPLRWNGKIKVEAYDG